MDIKDLPYTKELQAGRSMMAVGKQKPRKAEIIKDSNRIFKNKPELRFINNKEFEKNNTPIQEKPTTYPLMKNITFINAGAGSGKTYRLTTELARRLTQGGLEPSQVILTTYTELAAAEFREKARKEIENFKSKIPSINSNERINNRKTIKRIKRYGTKYA